MTRRLAISTLVTAFRALTKTQRGRQKYHVQIGTKILCGEDAMVYEYLKGG